MLTGGVLTEKGTLGQRLKGGEGGKCILSGRAFQAGGRTSRRALSLPKVFRNHGGSRCGRSRGERGEHDAEQKRLRGDMAVTAGAVLSLKKQVTANVHERLVPLVARVALGRKLQNTHTCRVEHRCYPLVEEFKRSRV